MPQGKSLGDLSTQHSDISYIYIDIYTHTCVVTYNYWVYYIQISKSQVYTHIRMSISTVYLYLHLHPYGYVYTQTLLRSVNPLQFSQPGHVLCLRCMHRREYLQLLEGALSRNWDVGHQNSDTAVWTNQPPNVGIFQLMRWARESIEVAMESRHPNTHTQIHATLLEQFFFGGFLANSNAIVGLKASLYPQCWDHLYKDPPRVAWRRMPFSFVSAKVAAVRWLRDQKWIVAYRPIVIPES